MSYSLHKISTEIEEEKPTQEAAKKLCREMLRIRHMELLLEELYKKKKIRGFCHLGIGQESISVGVSVHLSTKDNLLASYRCHGVALVSGMDPKEIVCEQLGSSDGCSKGKGGSMHMFGKRFFGGHGIVGAQIPLAAGLAFAEKYWKVPKDKESVEEKEAHKKIEAIGEWTAKAWKQSKGEKATVVFFGDGASNQGQFYETVNMAVLWGLPLVFVCENNGYGMGTANARASASETVYNRFSFIPGVLVDGSCVFKVADVFKYARKHALEKGPIILEITTYRYSGHSMTDTVADYRSEEEISSRRKNDPVENIKKHLGPDAEKVYEEIKTAAQKEMDTLGTLCLSSPRCKEQDLLTDILV